MSNPDHVPAVMHYLMGLAPHTLLDVGVGLGTYGFLARQFIDVAKERLEPANWQIRIDGIEVFEPYRNPIWDYYYDSVAIADIRDRVASLDSYDVILCNDVLEHFPQDEARALITGLLGKCRVLLATTPFSEYPQGAWGDNAAETHHCLLTLEDFPSTTQVHRAGITSLYVSWSDLALAGDIARLSRDVPRIMYPGESVEAPARGRLGRLLRMGRA